MKNGSFKVAQLEDQAVHKLLSAREFTELEQREMENQKTKNTVTYDQQIVSLWKAKPSPIFQQQKSTSQKKLKYL